MGFSDETKQNMLAVCNGFCHSPKCIKKVTSFHHMLPQTKYNRKHYPLFIDSVFNCFPACEDCHANYADKKISRKLAAVYEQAMRDLLNDTVF